MKTQQLSQYPSLNSISIACYPDCIRQSTPRELSEDIRHVIYDYPYVYTVFNHYHCNG